VRLTTCVRREVVDVALTSGQKETDMMLSSLKRFTVIAGITCGIAGAAPVALASAASAPSDPTSTLLSLLFPAQLTQSCDNQGLFPGIVNLGPTGPLGPLGPHGPLGDGNKNLPCGADAFNLGPSGPLGPHGPLGGPAGQ
jgi:hypothetical protein